MPHRRGREGNPRTREKYLEREMEKIRQEKMSSGMTEEEAIHTTQMMDQKDIERVNIFLFAREENPEENPGVYGTKETEELAKEIVSFFSLQFIASS